MAAFWSFLLVLVALPWTGARGEEISKEVAERAYYHAARILKEFPPERYYIVSFGLSTPVLNAAIRDLLDNPEAIDRYLVEFPVQKFNEKYGPEDAEMGQILKKMLPQGAAAGGREPVVLRVLMRGATIGEFIQGVQHAKAQLPPRVNAYLIGSTHVEPNLMPDSMQMGGGRTLVESDPELVGSLVYPWNGRDKPGAPGQFSRFNSFTPVDLLAPDWHLQEKPGWQQLDAAVSAHFRQNGVLTLPPSIPAGHLPGARAHLASVARRHGSLYELYENCPGSYAQVKR